MRKYFSLALLCLIVSVAAWCQDHFNQIGNDSLYIQDSVLIKTRDGALISAIIARKKGPTASQPCILSFTIYARVTDMHRRCNDAAWHGYVGVVAYTRGKRQSPNEPIPYEYDGRDVFDVIEWITKQPWCNGKVGMYGGSYSGFTQWAATKNLHPALKTIVPSASVAPGLDVPMTNNVVMSFVFPWTYYVTNNKLLDEKDYRDTIWRATYFKWFATGTSYTSLDSILGRRPNKVFRTWLKHPAYDAYWQNMISYKDEFAKINIPVLTTTGYFDDGQIGAMYYFREHYKYVPGAEHYLLIGPYGHFGSQGFPDSIYAGYPIDPVARISIHDIIFQWFDYVLKGASKPSLLKDKINFEVMGANEWKHVSSYKKMSNDTLKFYLSDQRIDTGYYLKKEPPRKTNSVQQMVDFSDRSTMNFYLWNFRLTWDSVNGSNGIVYVSDPLQNDVIISGAFIGEIKASINKKDFDFSINLFEQMPDGKLFYLSYFMGRAGYAKNILKRHLLTPGKIESIPFQNSYITVKKLSNGSRIVALVNVNKSPFEQINYGTGKDVNDETINDAKEPLRVKWYNSSYIKIPILK
ncbi:MAG: CocE/NonD family hydrolase [Bacteroidota bacterium]|nr:CocE/NonD family hydrolase [Bacteroidota bacterium]